MTGDIQTLPFKLDALNNYIKSVSLKGDGEFHLELNNQMSAAEKSNVVKGVQQTGYATGNMVSYENHNSKETLVLQDVSHSNLTQVLDTMHQNGVLDANTVNAAKAYSASSFKSTGGSLSVA